MGGHAASHGQHHLDRAGPQLEPTVGTRDSGQGAQPRANLERDLDQSRYVEGPLVGQSTGRGQPGRLVEEPEELRDDSAVRVGVNQQGGSIDATELSGQIDRDGRPARRSGGTPDRDDASRPAAV
jgi:hypothetical protein